VALSLSVTEAQSALLWTHTHFFWLLLVGVGPGWRSKELEVDLAMAWEDLLSACSSGGDT
jgi:hypothetical protein